MRKLKAGEVALYRETLLARQGGRCALCGEPINGDDVLDHDHKTGIVRGVLHRGCNAMLGHIENNRARNFLTDPVKLARFLRTISAYLNIQVINEVGAGVHAEVVLYPTFKTPDEKRLARNKKARVARQKAKA